MQKNILTICEKDYPIDSYSYSIYKTMDMMPNTVSSISISLEISGKNDLDSVMMDGLFSCTLTVCDENGAVIKQLAFEDAEIISYSNSANKQMSYSAIHIEARTVQFDGKRITVKSEL